MDVTTYAIIFNGFDVDGNREYYFSEFHDACHFHEQYFGVKISISPSGFTVTI
jgi:hypothetical protein